MIKFISANGRIGSYFTFTIENGDNIHSIGDQVWMNNTELEISEFIDEDVLEELLANFEHKSKMALKGALRRVGVVFG